MDGTSNLRVAGPATLSTGAQVGSSTGGATALTLKGFTTAIGTIGIGLGKIANEGTLSLADGAEMQGVGSSTGTLDNLKGATVSFSFSGSGSGPGQVNTNAADVTLGASPSSIVDQTNSGVFRYLSSNTGTLDLNSSVTAVATITNSGTMTIENGSTLHASGYAQSAVTTTVVGGSTLTPGEDGALINGGTLSGTGTVTTGVTNGGTVNPSGSVGGPLTVSGDYGTSGGTLRIPVQGVASAGKDFGALSVSGTATLGGPMQFVTAPAYLPPVGSKLTILNAAALSGTFSSTSGTELGDRHYVISYTPTSVVATVTADTPQITSLTPDAGATTGGNAVVIKGSGFSASPTVKFKSATATVLSSTLTQIKVTAPAAASTGAVSVRVTTPGGISPPTSADTYTYGRPTITAISPDAGAIAGGNTVAITGTGFTPDSTVKFGSVAATVKTETPTRITVSAPAVASPGRVTVYVHTPAGYSSGITYTYGAPTVTGISPTSGSKSGGTTVTTTGTNFTPDSHVAFGTASATPTDPERRKRRQTMRFVGPAPSSVAQRRDPRRPAEV